VLNPNETPPPQRSSAQEDLNVSGAVGSPVDHDPQVSAAGVPSNEGTLIIKTIPEVDSTTIASAMTSSMVGEAAVGGPRTTTGNGDSNELDVIMGHPSLRADGHDTFHATPSVGRAPTGVG
jgi:hypothetical protein